MSVEIGSATNADSCKMCDYRNVWFDALQCETVCIRRLPDPTISATVYETDVLFALKESKAMWNGALAAIAHHSRTINPPSSRITATEKLYQLKVARSIGFQIPDTLASNDPSEIRKFFARCRGNIVHKPFTRAHWLTETRTYSTYTQALREEHLQDDDALSACPGIFQELLSKKHELRVTVIGAEIYCIGILSQQDDIRSVDFRRQSGSREVTFISMLPTEIERLIFELMARLGISFGCIDLVVTKSDEFVFLEVNEMGAFLWGEILNPSLRLLDAFGRFLLRLNRSDQPLSYSDYYASAQYAEDAAEIGKSGYRSVRYDGYNDSL
jgi:hypothetical protein